MDRQIIEVVQHHHSTLACRVAPEQLAQSALVPRFLAFYDDALGPLFGYLLAMPAAEPTNCRRTVSLAQWDRTVA